MNSPLQSQIATYKSYVGQNLPNIYLVVPNTSIPEVTVPFNLLHIFGGLTLLKAGLRPSMFPFAKGGQRRIVDIVHEKGFCFYKWPGKILGDNLADFLEQD